MHANYSFHFLETVSKQLVDELEALTVSFLDAAALARLAADQAASNAHQGVYLLRLAGQPVYLGKADDVHDRLRQHLRKLSGRQNIDLAQVGYKALLLDKSMSTAANETVLIGLFRRHHEGMWNGTGFGPKDPGKNRDTTAPGPFDRDHPIKADYPLTTVTDVETVTSLFRKMKNELPYVFRYELTANSGNINLDLDQVPRSAEMLLRAAMQALEPGWQAAILSYGMVVYPAQKNYGPQVTTMLSPGR